MFAQGRAVGRDNDPPELPDLPPPAENWGRDPELIDGVEDAGRDDCGIFKLRVEFTGAPTVASRAPEGCTRIADVDCRAAMGLRACDFIGTEDGTAFPFIAGGIRAGPEAPALGETLGWVLRGSKRDAPDPSACPVKLVERV